MSKDIAKDIFEMHRHFKVHEIVESMDKGTLLKFLNFRMNMIQEEFNETDEAIMNSDPDEIVDGIIDLLVFALGTLDVFGVDINKAWDEVYEKNMQKEPGVKPERANPFGFPDLIKPPGWEAPSHKGNHGILPEVFGVEDEV